MRRARVETLATAAGAAVVTPAALHFLRDVDHPYALLGIGIVTGLATFVYYSGKEPDEPEEREEARRPDPRRPLPEYLETESFKLGPHVGRLVVPGAALALVIVALLAVVYGYALAYNPIVYVNPILTLILAWNVGAAAARSMAWTGTHSLRVTTIVAVSACLVAVATGWAAFAAAAGHGAGGASFLALVLSPADLLRSVRSIHADGWVEVFGTTVRGGWSWALSALELLTVLGLGTLRASVGVDDHCQCKLCGGDAVFRERLFGFAVPEEVLHQGPEAEIVRALARLDWAPVELGEGLGLVGSSVRPALLFGMGKCEHCAGPFLMSIEIHGQDSTDTLHLGQVIEKEVETAAGERLLAIARARGLFIGEPEPVFRGA